MSEGGCLLLLYKLLQNTKRLFSEKLCNTDECFYKSVKLVKMPSRITQLSLNKLFIINYRKVTFS